MLAIGCDHGGYDLKLAVMKHLDERGMAYHDFGCDGSSCDYPVIAKTVAEAVASGEYERGLLFCGTGIGVSIVANKVPGIRAEACSDTFSATMTRAHNNANILCLGGRVVGPGLANLMVDAFLDTPFEGGRHQRRIDMITELDKR